ncbi:hypothetical protein M378DRAFT_564481 [Amanita muscaria Koide BX008]|uniref:Uncharacterized protein n=1 Tax=Amanita muscaria (strain Koide BX008) TaxID=946122 RepID=A0A0C2TDB8_AMAMK|nr:hypothetical protein M378DRAFT_564481 [Amanita muscaria Koide BX008]
MRDISMSPKPLDFAKIAQSYTSFIDKNGSVSLKKKQRNSTLDGVNVHALAKSTRKTLKRLAPFCLLRPIGPVRDDALVNEILVKIKGLIDGIDSSMLATQAALRLANEVLRLAETTKSPTDQKSGIVPRRAIEGMEKEKLAGIATLGEKYAQQSGTIFKDVAQDLHEVAAMTKEKRDVMVIVPLLDPDQPDQKSLHDVGFDLHANLNLLTDFAEQVSALADWLAFVRKEIEFASAAASQSQNTGPDAQPASPTLPGAMTLPLMLNVGVWTKIQVDYHSYFRTIRQVQSHYHNLVSASFEAWQLSAKSISIFSPEDGSDSDRPMSPSPPAPPPNPTPTSPTNSKLSIKKVQEFLSTRFSPRPEVKGLFPTSSSTSGPSERKGKGKEKEKRE